MWCMFVNREIGNKTMYWIPDIARKKEIARMDQKILVIQKGLRLIISILFMTARWKKIFYEQKLRYQRYDLSTPVSVHRAFNLATIPLCRTFWPVPIGRSLNGGGVGRNSMVENVLAPPILHRIKYISLSYCLRQLRQFDLQLWLSFGWKICKLEAL